MVKDIFPKFKKKVSDFMKQEDGKITKQSALALGTFTFGAVLGSLRDVQATVSHTNGFSGVKLEGDWTDSSGMSLTMNHNNHASHSSHSTHSTHGSHSSY